MDRQHLLSLRLVIDYDSVFNSLDDAVRSGDRNKIVQIAHLARLLTETVQCFGTLFTDQMTCYKVLKDHLYFTSFTIGVCEPLVAFTTVK